ncbi:MAG: response regulator [Desulfovibrio sp.]|jgi:putative two-component system response regulator|nr:response regulator [Desulfovibrio sp.]
MMTAQSRTLVMLVDDNRTNLMVGKTALSEDYSVLTAPSALKMLDLLRWSKPELILLDVDMPEMNGFGAIAILKADPKTKDIPVVFLTALNASEDELRGLQLGAVDYITKPFAPPLLRKRVALHLQLERQKRALQNYNDNLQSLAEAKTKTILKLQNKILTAMVEMVEGRDGTTGQHIANTQRYLRCLLSAVTDRSIAPAESLGWDVDLLIQSSQLHDVGKIAVSDEVLKKPGKLTPAEFDEMKQHVGFGVSFIERLEDDEDDSRFLYYAKTFAAYHHEKWNGTGYPHGLAGENIPLLGRMMAVADVYDALTSERPYKKPFTHDQSLRIIVEGKGVHFDPMLVDLFTQVSESFTAA